MSHFSVLVISKDSNEIDKKLAPFCEQVEKGDQYASFKSTEEEDRKAYETDGRSSFYGRDIDGVSEGQYNEFKKNHFIHFHKISGGMFILNRKMPIEEGVCQISYWKKGQGWHKRLYGVMHDVKEEVIKEENKDVTYYSFDVLWIPGPKKIPFTSIYKTFEDYEKEWNGNNERDPEMGEYGYWHNENAKWDWYQIGGRWAGQLMKKRGKEGKKGRPSLLMDDFSYRDREVDQLQFKDIDVEAMIARDRKRAGEDWDKALKKAEDRAVEFYDTGKVDKKEFSNRKRYVEKQVKGDLDFMERLGKLKTKEDYIEKITKEHPLQTFAILTKEGEWLQQGKMGWWGMVSNEDKEKYNRDFEEVLNTIEPNDYVTMVDCHI